MNNCILTHLKMIYTRRHCYDDIDIILGQRCLSIEIRFNYRSHWITLHLCVSVSFLFCLVFVTSNLSLIYRMIMYCPFLPTAPQIEKDLLRTMPSNACFSSLTSVGVPRLRRVLRGLAWLYPDIGYCQGTGMVRALWYHKLHNYGNA